MRRVLATLAVALILAGCGGGDEGDPTATGTVLEVQQPGDPLVFTLNTEPQNALNGAIITVAAKDLEGAEPDEVARGDTVKVWATTCRESFPPQCTATHVTVTGR